MPSPEIVLSPRDQAIVKAAIEGAQQIHEGIRTPTIRASLKNPDSFNPNKIYLALKEAGVEMYCPTWERPENEEWDCFTFIPLHKGHPEDEERANALYFERNHGL